MDFGRYSYLTLTWYKGIGGVNILEVKSTKLMQIKNQNVKDEWRQ